MAGIDSLAVVLEPYRASGETLNQFRERVHGIMEEPKPKGIWVIYAYDVTAYPIAAFMDETEALRISNRYGYTNVAFWRFNQLWEDFVKRLK